MTESLSFQEMTRLLARDKIINKNTVKALNQFKLKKIIKSVAYSSQGRHTGQLDFCN